MVTEGSIQELRKYAIACVIVGRPHLYLSAIQFEPRGSISLCRKGENDPLARPMIFISEVSAQAVINVIVQPKKMAELFEWKVVEYDGVR